MTKAIKSYLAGRIENCRTIKQVELQEKAIDQYAYSEAITDNEVRVLLDKCEAKRTELNGTV